MPEAAPPSLNPAGGYVAIAGAVANSAYSALGELTPAAARQRKRLLADTDRMNRGELGDSQATQAARLGQDQRALMAGSAGRSGAYFNSAADANKQATDALAGQAAKYNEESSQRALMERQSILTRLNTQGGIGRAAWHRKGDIAERGAEKFAGAAGTTGHNVDTQKLATDFGDM